MSEWLTIEVFDGPIPASAWWRAHGEHLIESALTNGATDWVQHTHRWGVVLELEFPEDSYAEAYRALPVVLTALDAVPDRESGLLVYRGRGGGAGARVPRHPRPHLGAGAGALPTPEPQFAAGLGLAEPPSPLYA